MDVQDMLDQAIERQNTALVRKLIEQGASLSEHFRDGRLPLARAASTGNVELVKLLLESGAEVDGASKPNQSTALYLATSRGFHDVVDTLIRAGADVNQTDDIGLFPLLAAAIGQEDGHTEVIRSLIRAGANLEAGKLVTPLMRACAQGLLEHARALLEAGANPNAMRPRNGTPLHMAIRENQTNAVALLLEHGADPTLQTPVDADHPNLTSLDFAKKLGRKRIVALLGEAGGSRPTVAVSAPSDAWKKVKNILKEVHPRVYKSLRPPAEPAILKKAEKAIGEALPESFKLTYFTNDGQKDTKRPLVPAEKYLESGYFLLPLRQILNDWNMQKKLLNMGEFEGRKASADKEVAKEWWHVKWFPFAGDGHGDYLCLDLAPTSSGTRGQVISFSHESGRRRLVTSGFSQWLCDLADKLASGKT